VFIYLDDVIVGSRSEEEHVRHLHLVFTRLQQYGLVLNMDKCQFGVQEVEFLGHDISSAGAKPLDRHVQAIRRFPKPVDAKQLQRFLGLVNFYRRFIPGAAGILRPLSDALRGQGRSKWQWSPTMEAAFEKGKEAVCRATQLAHPDPEAEISLAADASDTHIGAVLQQKTAAGWQPLSFYSKKLSATEERYSAFDRELWAVFSGIRHFRYLLEGRRFHVLTDHKPLTTALHRVSEPWSAKQQRQLAYIAEYTADIRHIAGRENVVADALSRPGGATAAVSPSVDREAGGSSPPSKPGTDPLRVETRVRQPLINRPGPQSTPSELAAVAAGVAQPVDFNSLAAEQAACADCRKVLGSQSSLQFSEFNLGARKLVCDVSTGAVRPLVPSSWRRRVFTAVHGIAHPGTRATRRMLVSRFMWPGMASDIAKWCRECIECARGKITRNVHSPVQPIPVPVRRFAHVHVDLVGPLPVSREGFTHLFTMVDRSTRWAEAVW
jgi:cleavage and polyadenylation specificity factor subunit 1